MIIKNEIDVYIKKLFGGRKVAMTDNDPVLGSLTKLKAFQQSVLISSGNFIELAYRKILKNNNEKEKINMKGVNTKCFEPDAINWSTRILYEIKRGHGDGDTTKATGVYKKLVYIRDHTDYAGIKLISHYGMKYFRSNHDANKEFGLHGKEEINKHFGFNIWDQVEENLKYLNEQFHLYYKPIFEEESKKYLGE